MERITVVLADDHTLFREGTREILERDGSIEVIGEASDGLAAVDLVAELRPDIAILDIEMPGGDGIEATRRIRAAQPQVGILVLTMHDEDPFVFAILDAGASGYLLKDVPSSELVRAVHALRTGEAVLHPSIVAKVLQRVREPTGHSADPTAVRLTDRERTVLKLAARGQTNPEIADALCLSTRTVQLSLTGTFQRLGVASRTEAVIAALRAGIFDLDELAP